MKKIHDIFDATAHALAGLLFLSNLASGQFGQSQVFDGLEGLLRAKPFEGEVLTVKSGEASFTLSVRATDGSSTNTIQQMGGGLTTVMNKAVAHLQEGKTYIFPRCLFEHLTDDEAALLRREEQQMPPGSTTALLTPPPAGFTSTGFEQFVSCPLFRARVLDQIIGEDRYCITIESTDGVMRRLAGKLTDETRRIAAHLTPGLECDFPTVLRQALLSDAGRKAAARPSSPKLDPLRRYVGEWRGRMDSNPLAEVKMKCAWLDDGSGIWREVRFDLKNGATPMLDLAVVTYDDDRKCFRVTDQTPNTAPPAVCTWDAATRSFAFVMPGRDDARSRRTIATFSSADRIDWHTLAPDADGTVTTISSGRYDRVNAPSRPRSARPASATWKTEDAPPLQTSGPPLRVPPAGLPADITKAEPFLARVIAKRRREDVCSLLLDALGGRNVELVCHHSQGDAPPPLGCIVQQALSNQRLKEQGVPELRSIWIKLYYGEAVKPNR